MINYSLRVKQTGFVLIIISVILFLLFLSITYEIVNTTNILCKEFCAPEAGISCPHEKSIPIQSYLGFTTVFILAGIGVFMFLTDKKYQEELTVKAKKIEKTLANLTKDEKKIYKLVKENGGIIFQSELVEKSGFSKAKVSRILDKLESKNLVERRRRGMSNVIVLRTLLKEKEWEGIVG